MILRLKLAMTALLLILVACSPRSTVPPAEIAQYEQPPASVTTAATATSAAPTAVPTRAEPAEINLVLPVPQPLSGPAPWVMFPCAESQENRAPTIANGDGTGCVPVTLPTELPADRSWITTPALRGSYVAFRDTIRPAPNQTQDTAYRLERNSLDGKIWIVKLPENRIIRTISQIDAEGWARIQGMWENSPGQGSNPQQSVPLPLAVILEPGAYAWSPDGRFLAYTGVDKAGVDLFVYDSLTDTIRRMTRGRQGAFFWSWSPDNKWIVYHEMAGCHMENGRCQLEQGPNYYAVSFPAPEYQFENSFLAGNINWIAKDRYILEDNPTKGQLHTHLVEVDLEFGTVTRLYDQPFLSNTYVPDTYTSKKEMYLLNLPAAPDSDRVTGIYLLTPRTGELKPFHTNKYAEYIIQWERTLERFILEKELYAEPLLQMDVFLAPVQMVLAIPLGDLSSSELAVSPDGQWFAARLGNGKWGLFTAHGKLIQELSGGYPGVEYPVTWLKNSNGFYLFASGNDCPTDDGCILSYSMDQEWRPIPAGEMVARPDKLQVIDP